MPSQWSNPAFETVARLVQANTGLAFPSNSSGSAEAGTRRAMERIGVTEVTTYLRLLESGEAALADLVDELAVSETYFFRQPAQFDFIARNVLPELRTRCGTTDHIHAWSAGCASGEEPFSLAILFDRAGIAEGGRIVATDISRPALAKANEASYGISSLRGVDEKLVREYFHRVRYREVLDERIRRRVSFAYLNLTGEDYPWSEADTRGMDLILCRNVLIYFDPATVREVAKRLVNALAEGGWLITGASDPVLPSDLGLESIVTDQGVFYRRARGTTKGTRGLAPASHGWQAGRVH